MDRETIRQTIRKMTPGSTLILAPDVYDSLAEGQVLEQEVMGVVGLHSIKIQRNHAMKPGTAMIMAEAHFPPPPGWASRFLAKSGPVPFGVVTDMDDPVPASEMHLGLVVPPKVFEPEPAPAPASSWPRGTRCRVVDT